VVLRTTLSAGLSETNAQNVVDGICHSSRLGFRLNTSTTIHLERAGIYRPYPFMSTYNKHASDWLRRRGSCRRFAQVFENPTDIKTGLSGLHCHQLEYIPAELFQEYLRQAPRWIELAGGHARPGVFHSRQLPWGGPDGTPLCEDPPLLLKTFYELKGYDGKSSVPWMLTPQGSVSGSRARLSQSMTRKARGNSLSAAAPADALTAVDILPADCLACLLRKYPQGLPGHPCAARAGDEC
jgi:hypothetical protein